MKDTSYKQVLLIKFNKSKNIGIKSFFFSPVWNGYRKHLIQLISTTAHLAYSVWCNTVDLLLIIPAFHLNRFLRFLQFLCNEWKSEASQMLKHIPEFFPRGISPRVVLTFLVRLPLVLTLFFLSSTTIGIRDGRLFWSLLTEILCSRALLAASFSDKDPLSLSLLRRVILTGILDFFCRGGTWFWWLFFSGWSHEAIASHPRFSLARWKLLLK